MRTATSKTVDAAAGALTITAGPFALTRVAGGWKLTAPDTMTSLDLWKLAEIAALAGNPGAPSPPADPVERGLASVEGMTESAAAVDEARSSLESAGSFGASLGDDFLREDGEGAWPAYTFASDTTMLAAAYASPPTHDMRGLWRAIQDRLGRVLPEKERYSRYRAQAEFIPDATHAALQAVLPVVQERAFGPSHTFVAPPPTDPAVSFDDPAHPVVHDMNIPYGVIPYEWLQETVSVRHLVAVGGAPDVIANALLAVRAKLGLSDDDMRDFADWACGDTYAHTDAVLDLVEEALKTPVEVPPAI